MNTPIIPVKFAMKEGATLPLKHTSGSCGRDLFTLHEVVLKPGELRVIDTGIQLEMPPGFFAVIAPRSGITMRGIEVKMGYVDSDFRGSIGIMTRNLNNDFASIPKNTRLAQLILQQHFDILSVVCNVGELSKTERDQGGFGSTGGDAVFPMKDIKSIVDGKSQ